MKDGSKMLVTSVQKLFNGLTKFGLNRQSVAIETLLMDDAHACADRSLESINGSSGIALLP
jgi:replicative superfamily II helicase